MKNWKTIIIISLLFSILFGLYATVNTGKSQQTLETDEAAEIAEADETADAAEATASTSGVSKKMIIGFLVGLLVSCILVTIRFVNDDTYRIEADVNEYAALPVLTRVYFPPKNPKPAKKGISEMWRRL